jgi:outer membrane beta-barrel protein
MAFALLVCLTISARSFASGSGVIEKQLADIGSVSNDEVIVVQRQFTSKKWRHELTPLTIGGIPFGTVRQTLLGGASYTLHANEWLGLELFNFAYTQTFFTSFADDINNNKAAGLNPNANNIQPDYQKLLYFVTAGIQLTPFYGKVSTFSRWIAYLEPYVALGAGLSKTESNSYFTFYPAVGLRAYFKEWLSAKLEFRDYMYTEQDLSPTSSLVTNSNFRNNYAVTISLSFWLPKMPG